MLLVVFYDNRNIVIYYKSVIGRYICFDERFYYRLFDIEYFKVDVYYLLLWFKIDLMIKYFI